MRMCKSTVLINDGSVCCMTQSSSESRPSDCLLSIVMSDHVISLVPSPSTCPARIACTVRAGKIGLDIWLEATRNLCLECGGGNFYCYNILNYIPTAYKLDHNNYIHSMPKFRVAHSQTNLPRVDTASDPCWGSAWAGNETIM